MLDILGIGLALPPARKIRDLVAAAGGDPALHEGWDHACIANADDHPSTFASSALAAALAEANLAAQQLDLVLAVGVSRDFGPPWSLAHELMRMHGVANTCFGFDLTLGCVGSLVGLHTALGWLARTGGYAAIVTAERWSHTVDRSDPELRRLWGHADGGGAIVVGVDRPGAPLATFHGAVFTTHSAYNGAILVKYGGTRFPSAPPGEDPGKRTIAEIPASELWATYEAGYGRIAHELTAQFASKPERVVCNQTSPNVVKMIARILGLELERACTTGHAYGHVGGADIMLGLRRLIDRDELDGPVAMLASVPVAFGGGLVTPPVRR